MSKEETNKQIVQLTAAMNAYFKRATELEEQRAKADEQRAKEARELEERRAKADEQRAKEARELEEQRAKEARELEEQRAKEARELEEQRAKADEKRAKADEQRAKEAKELDERRAKEAKELDERRAKAAAEDTQKLKNTVEGLAEKVDKVTMQVDKVTRQMKETDKIFRKVFGDSSVFNNTGSVTEEKFFSALKSQKRVGNTTFKSLQRNICILEDKPNGRSAELDIVMHNGIYSLIIEVKYLCHFNDVDRFEKKMRKAHAYISKEFNNRKLLFGMAANKFNKDAADYAHEHGMILFHPDGQKVRTDTTACALVHPDTSA